MTVTKKNKHTIKCALIISTTINLCNYNAWAYFNNEEKNTELDIPETRAIDVNAFLETLGICIHYAQGVDVRTYVEPLNYLGIKNIRDDLGKPQGYVFLRKQSGIKSAVIANSKDLSLTINSLKYMAREDALLAVEGPNEPNNFPIEYQGEFGGGFANLSKKPANWLPVANFQKDLYAAVKGEKILANYPVFNVSEVGAQTPNVGLQYLEIPTQADTVLPAGTRFADFLNVHNYVIGTQNRYVDNQAWSASDPLLSAGWDGLYPNHGKLWGHGYDGYDAEKLPTIPKVTTETGWDSKANPGGEETQGKVLLNTYLSQFKRGWRYTFIYMIRDGEGGAGNQGVYNADSSPKLAAKYIHNFTTILASNEKLDKEIKLSYFIKNRSDTVHDILLQTKSHEYAMIIWGEKISGSDEIVVKLKSRAQVVYILDPTIDHNPIQILNNTNEIALRISDHPVILKISP